MDRDRRHLVLTVGPITVLFILELLRFWPALGGASVWAAASPTSWFSMVGRTAVLLASFAAYIAGWTLLQIDPQHGAGPYPSVGSLRLQRWAGALAWTLALGHLGIQWFMLSESGPIALSHYELLRDLLSRPFVMALYVLGLAAFGLFVSQGLAALLRSLRGSSGSESSRWIDVGCTVVSATMVLLAVNVVSHFATGRAYWSGDSGRPSDSIPTDASSPR